MYRKTRKKGDLEWKKWQKREIKENRECIKYGKEERGNKKKKNERKEEMKKNIGRNKRQKGIISDNWKETYGQKNKKKKKERREGKRIKARKKKKWREYRET